VKVLRVAFKAMGTPCELQLYAPHKALARKAADLAIADVQRLEARYSRYRADSLLSAINRCAAAGAQMDVDDETAHLLDYAQTCYELSDGLFDITSGLLRKAWNFHEPRLPDPALIASLLQHVGWQKLRWERPVLTFAQPGMEIDMGGMVKEYAADRAATLCQSVGIAHGMVNLGGRHSHTGAASGRFTLAGGHPASAAAGRVAADGGNCRRSAGQQWRLRAMHRAGWCALWSCAEPAHGLAGAASGGGHGACAIVRAGGQRVHDRHVEGGRGPALAGRAGA
jgi:hypothetical protein